MVVWERKRLIGYWRKERYVWRTIAKLWKENMISRQVKKELYEILVISTVVYGSEIWSLSVQEKRKIEIFEMMFRKTYVAKREWTE